MSTTELLNETENKLLTNSEIGGKPLEKSGNGGELGLLSALIDSDAWNRLAKMAEIFAKSTLIPDHFRGNVGNCMIGLQLAIRMEVDPFMLMQNMYVVSGNPGLEAKFAIAMCNSKGVFNGRIRFDLSGEGKTRECVAYAFDKETGERVECTVTFAIAEKEGWVEKKGSKWKTMPDQMLKYRSAMWLIRTTCPEVLMGMQSTDELHDIAPQVVESPVIVDDRPKSDQLADQLEKQSGNGKQEPEAAETSTEAEPPWPSSEPQADTTLFKIFEADMKAAPNPKALEKVKKKALAESQAGRLPMEDWQFLLFLFGKLEKSFGTDSGAV